VRSTTPADSAHVRLLSSRCRPAIPRGFAAGNFAVAGRWGPLISPVAPRPGTPRSGSTSARSPVPAPAPCARAIAPILYYRHRQGFRSYLYLAHAERIGGLQGMSALRLPSTASTPPHLYVKAADDGHPQDVLLVLRLGIVQDHRTVTVWAVRRERYGDLLIHPAANRSGGPLPVCRARLASRRLRVTFGFPLGKRCGVSLVSSQGLFQLLPQALVLRQCALQLLLQGLDSPFEFLPPIRGANAIGRLHPFHDDTNAEICSELSLKALYLLSYPLVNILKQPGRVCKSVMKVLIVGRGVVGTIYGWALSKAGIDVTHVVRKELPGTAALDLLDLRPGYPRNTRVPYAPKTVGQIGPSDAFDLVIVAPKHSQAPEAIRQYLPGAPRATFLLFTANWDGTAEIDRLLPRSSILCGYAAASGGPDAQGILIATVAPTVRFGMLEGSDPEKYKA